MPKQHPAAGTARRREREERRIGLELAGAQRPTDAVFKEVAARIKHWLDGMQMSQREFAEITRVPRSAICEFLSRSRRPRLDTWIAIRNALPVEVRDEIDQHWNDHQFEPDYVAMHALTSPIAALERARAADNSGDYPKAYQLIRAAWKLAKTRYQRLHAKMALANYFANRGFPETASKLYAEVDKKLQPPLTPQEQVLRLRAQNNRALAYADQFDTVPAIAIASSVLKTETARPMQRGWAGVALARSWGHERDNLAAARLAAVKAALDFRRARSDLSEAASKPRRAALFAIGEAARVLALSDKPKRGVSKLDMLIAMAAARQDYELEAWLCAYRWEATRTTDYRLRAKTAEQMAKITAVSAFFEEIEMRDRPQNDTNLGGMIASIVAALLIYAPMAIVCVRLVCALSGMTESMRDT